MLYSYILLLGLIIYDYIYDNSVIRFPDIIWFCHALVWYKVSGIRYQVSGIDIHSEVNPLSSSPRRRPSAEPFMIVISDLWDLGLTGVHLPAVCTPMRVGYLIT